MASEAKAMKMGRAEADMGFMAGIRLKRLARFAAARKQKSLRGKASLNLSPWSRVLPQEPLPLFHQQNTAGFKLDYVRAFFARIFTIRKFGEKNSAPARACRQSSLMGCETKGFTSLRRP